MNSNFFFWILLFSVLQRIKYFNYLETKKKKNGHEILGSIPRPNFSCKWYGRLGSYLIILLWSFSKLIHGEVRCYRDLDLCFWHVSMYTNPLWLLFRWRSWPNGSGVGPVVLHFTQAPQGGGLGGWSCCSTDHILSGRESKLNPGHASCLLWDFIQMTQPLGATVTLF